MPILFAFAFALALFAPRPAQAEPGDELTAYVITFGPGDHPFYKFGHDAIWIHNAAAAPVDQGPRDPVERVLDDVKRNCRGPSNSIRKDPVYNWGTFAFGDPALIPKFIQGRFMYWLSKQSICYTVQAYHYENRTVEAQELNLTAAQKKALYDLVEDNAREENKFYKYDYYRDNCATRVRDAVDNVLGGKLKAASQGPAQMSWRHHTLRLTADDKVLSLALTVVMSSLIDKPINQWEEMFLPAYVQQGVRRVTVPGPEGKEIPLVKSERVLTEAKDRAPLRTEVPSWGIFMFMAGLAYGGALFAAGLFARQKLWARIAMGALLFGAGFLCLLGCLFVFAWFGTDHEVGYHNENILQLLPFNVALLGFCFGVARLRPRTIERVKWLVTIAAGASAFGLLWKVLPWMRQDNYWIIAFCLPMWAGAVMGMRALEDSLKGAAAVVVTKGPMKGSVMKKGAKKGPKGEAPREEEREPDFIRTPRTAERRHEAREEERAEEPKNNARDDARDSAPGDARDADPDEVRDEPKKDDE